MAIPFRAAVEQTRHRSGAFSAAGFTKRFPGAHADRRAHVTRRQDASPTARSARSGSGRWRETRRDGSPTSDALEFFPSFSPDGQSIVFATWSDADRRPRAYRSRRWIECARSRWRARPLRRAVLLARRAVGRLSLGAGGRHSQHHARRAPGIFIVPASGGAPALVREGGDDPQFDHTGSARLLPRPPRWPVRAGERDPQRRRRSRALPFGERDRDRSVARRQVGGVCRTLASRSSRRSRARAGRSTSRRAHGGFPVNQISRDAGFSLHWSADSRRVHWMLGPEFFSRDVRRASHSSKGATEQRDHAGSDGCRDRIHRQGRRADEHDRLHRCARVTMAGGQVIENATVIVEGNRIKAIGRNVAVPAGATRVDARGKTIMPASSTRMRISAARATACSRETSWPLLANLAFGVTTSHDPSNDTETVFTNSELVRSGAQARAAPRFRPARSSTAPKRRSRPPSRTTTMRYRTCDG